jgi:hypothetical protein
MDTSFFGVSLSSFLKYVDFAFSDPDVLTNAIDPGIGQRSNKEAHPLSHNGVRKLKGDRRRRS